MNKYEITKVVNGDMVVFTLLITMKRIKNIIFRAHPTLKNTFNVSVPFKTSISETERAFDMLFPKLLKLLSKSRISVVNNNTYVFGKLLTLEEIVQTYQLTKEICDEEVFYKQMHIFTMKYLKHKVAIFSKEMAIPLIYKVRLRKMTTRWATNSSKTNSLTFNREIIHFSPEIIDSLIVHELVHYFVKGHGKEFYLMTEKYYPNYKYFDKYLKGRIYEFHN